MAILQLKTVNLDVDFDLEFHDHAQIPAVSGGVIRVEKPLSTQEAAAIAGAIRGSDHTPVTTPHGSGIVSIKAMRWNPTTGVLHGFEGVIVREWTFTSPVTLQK